MKLGRPITLAAVLITLLIVLGIAYHFALQRLKAGIEGALGPRASVGSLSVGWSGVQIESLRVRAVRGAWPAEDELRAARVRLVPSLASLWGSGWRVRHIEIEDAYLSILRSADGRLRVLPALLEQPAPAGAANRPSAHVHVAQIALQAATLDIYDASVRQPPHAMRLDELRAKVGPLDWPALDTAADVSVQARFKGPNHDGRIQIDGTLTPATREAALKAKVQGVDLLALQPYLLKVNEGGVKRGTLDLALDARVKGKQLSAPGTLVLTNMELASGGGMFATFAGVPRQAVIAAMQRDGRIEVNFTLEGRLDDPAFSINDNLATRLAGGLAQALGVSIGGVVEGVGNVIKGLFGR